MTRAPLLRRHPRDVAACRAAAALRLPEAAGVAPRTRAEAPGPGPSPREPAEPVQEASARARPSTRPRGPGDGRKWNPATAARRPGWSWRPPGAEQQGRARLPRASSAPAAVQPRAWVQEEA